jgi:hypothetical protein
LLAPAAAALAAAAWSSAGFEVRVAKEGSKERSHVDVGDWEAAAASAAAISLGSLPATAWRIHAGGSILMPTSASSQRKKER